MSLTYFDPELLNAVKDRSIKTSFKTKRSTPEKEKSDEAKPATLEHHEDPAAAEKTGTELSPVKSEDVTIEYEKVGTVQVKPKLAERVISKTPAKPVVVRKITPKSGAKPVVVKKIIAKSGKGLVTPTISEVVSLQSPTKPAVFKKVLVKSNAGSSSPAISELSQKTPRLAVTPRIVLKSNEGSTIPRTSEVEASGKAEVFPEVIVKSEAGSPSPPPEGLIPIVGARPVLIQKTSKSESVMQTTVEGVSSETLSPVMIPKVVIKSETDQRSPTLGTPSIPQRILVHPDVSAVRILKPTADIKVFEGTNSESLRVSPPPHVSEREAPIPLKAVTSEEVNTQRGGESQQQKPSIGKAKGAIKPNVLKVAVLKKDAVATKPNLTLVKPQAITSGMLGLDKRSKTLLARNAYRQWVSKNAEVSSNCSCTL